MTTLVERLRGKRGMVLDEVGRLLPDNDYAEAADEIERLQVEVERARELAMLRTCDLNREGKTILDFYEVWLRQANAEIERLKHDIERHVAIAAEQATEIARLTDRGENVCAQYRERGHALRDKAAASGCEAAGLA